NFLIDVKPRVDVHIDNKFVYLKTAVPLSEESEIVSRMGEIMKTILGIRGIKVVTSSHRNSNNTGEAPSPCPTMATSFWT
ncbi:MAG: hypothetical protein MUO68_24095, partial [Desulfobacteraceae bacterium]|nr:hypothetical protein [Desulfobacteraceae bacterium]